MLRVLPAYLVRRVWFLRPWCVDNSGGYGEGTAGQSRRTPGRVGVFKGGVWEHGECAGVMEGRAHVVPTTVPCSAEDAARSSSCGTTQDLLSVPLMRSVLAFLVLGVVHCLLEPTPSRERRRCPP